MATDSESEDSSDDETCVSAESRFPTVTIGRQGCEPKEPNDGPVPYHWRSKAGKI